MRIFSREFLTSTSAVAGLRGFFLIVLAAGTTFGQPPGDGSGESDSEMEYYDEAGDGSETANTQGHGSARDATVQSFGSTMSSVLQSVDFSAMLAPVSADKIIDTGPVLSSDAKHAYQHGNYPLALELFYGHMVTEYEEARDDLQAVAYSKLLRRPVWQIRFGVSFAIRGDRDADPQPINEGSTPAHGGPPGGDPRPNLELQPMTLDGFDAGGFGSGSRPDARMLDAEANGELKRYVGLVADVVAEEFETRYREGDFGPALVHVEEAVPGSAPASDGEEADLAVVEAPMSEEVANALADSAQPRPLWRAGVMYFGEGESVDVLRNAKRENVDVLLHFDIYLKPLRQEYVQNVSRCRVFHVASSKSLGISKGIDNFEAIKLAKSGRKTEREYVTMQLEDFFGVIDRTVKTIELPKLTPEVAKRRIGTLLSGANFKGLRNLAEIRLYQLQELITEEEVAAAFDIIDGEDALVLLYSPLEERLTMARKWAVRSVPEIDN